MRRDACRGALLPDRGALRRRTRSRACPLPPGAFLVGMGNVDATAITDVYGVVSVDVNSAWNPDTFQNDTTMPKLNRPAPYAPLRVVNADESAKWAAGTTATVIGWGATDDGEPTSDVLLEAQVPVISDASCGSFEPGFDSTTMVCAYDGTHDTCQGDSGGPLWSWTAAASSSRESPRGDSAARSPTIPVSMPGSALRAQRLGEGEDPERVVHRRPGKLADAHDVHVHVHPSAAGDLRAVSLGLRRRRPVQRRLRLDGLLDVSHRGLVPRRTCGDHAGRRLDRHPADSGGERHPDGRCGAETATSSARAARSRSSEPDRIPKAALSRTAGIATTTAASRPPAEPRTSRRLESTVPGDGP